MAGGGNDFVVVDNRSGIVEDPNRLARIISTRRLSVGADGLILLDRSARATFRMRYFNADGSEAAFCANGTRCAARFAFLNVIAQRHMTIETGAGTVTADIVEQDVVLQLGSPRGYLKRQELSLLNGETAAGSFVMVGVPHYVIQVNGDLWMSQIGEMSREIRRHAQLGPEGANVDWVRVLGRDRLDVRTWERGVEDETLSCGSGVVASVAVAAFHGLVDSTVSVLTRSGIRYEVSWNRLDAGDGPADSIEVGAMKIRGDARLVFKATVTNETLEGFDEEWVRNPGRQGGPRTSKPV